MLIIPAIDIMGGACVRLTQGDFAAKKAYSTDACSYARQFEQQGAPMLHLVDLDGARSGKPINQESIFAIRKAVNIPIQVGGGIRTLEAACAYLDAGINRIILGTAVVQNIALLKKLLERFGSDRIIVSLDAKDNKLMLSGWQQTSLRDIYDAARSFQAIGVATVVVTDITRDGMLGQPNFEIMDTISQLGLNVIASGGVSDVGSILKLKARGIGAAIVGKAFYENKMTLKEALMAAQSNLAKRIIPCLDVKDGRVVKGVNFEGLQDAGDPVELAQRYSAEGADELVFLDIGATCEGRSTLIEMVQRAAQKIDIPFTVGGGIRCVQDMQNILAAGADKVSLNSAAVLRPALITEGAQLYGSQCIVVAIDARRVKNGYCVSINGGSEKKNLDVVAWAREAEQRGAGEILLTSIDRDGTKTGFDIELLKAVCEAVNIPVIASGGAGAVQDIADALVAGKADAALAASLFHFSTTTIPLVKEFLLSRNIPVRI